MLLRSSVDGRLDLLLRAVFHPLVALAGLLLLVVALVQLRLAFGAGGRERGDSAPGPHPAAHRRHRPAGAAAAAGPSFADLASQRPRDKTAESELSFVLPPAQRSLTDWVRLLRSQPDPQLFVGDPVRISGFVLPMPDEPPQLARLLVRCCLADARRWGCRCAGPRDRPPPAPTSGWPSKG